MASLLVTYASKHGATQGIAESFAETVVASGLHDNIRDICRQLADEGYTALGVDLFAGRNRPICMARMFLGWATGKLDFIGVRDLKMVLGQLAERPEVDPARIGAVGFCLGGTYVITWACTDNRLKAIAPFYGSAPRQREAIRRLCPVDLVEGEVTMDGIVLVIGATIAGILVLGAIYLLR